VRILYLTHRLPYAPNRGDRTRAYHMLHEIAQWASVDLVSLVHDAEEASHVDELRGVTTSVTIAQVSRTSNIARAILALPTDKPITHSLLRAPGLRATIDRLVAERRPDVVLASGTGVAPLAFLPGLAEIPFVLDMVDVDSAKWAALATTHRPPLSWIYAREARVLRRFERLASLRARATFIVTEGERETLTAIAPDARTFVVGNGVDIASWRRPAHATTDEIAPAVVFCGVMNYAPNVEGTTWFARHVWPIVRSERRDARFQIVGLSPTTAIQRLASQEMGIEVTGGVPDVRPYLWSAAVSVAPLLTARGVQNKVLEAIAADLPVVTTPIVMAGLPEGIRMACTVATDPGEFARAVIDLLERPDAARRAGPRAIDLGSLSWKRRLEPVRGLIEGASTASRR